MTITSALPDHAALASSFSPWRFCVAPMMDWTDRWCRRFHRQLSCRARLYTEMVTTGALLHGDVASHLDFDAIEQPLALQLGGSDPQELAQCAQLGERWGYAEINLNCGCPSARVQRGAFGACLMAEPALVADCIKAMQDVVSIPVTVKHRIGLGRDESYGFVRDFVGQLFDAGCRVFLVHARNAWLEGLSPKENREIPPLRPDVVVQLKKDFADAVFVLNGGLTNLAQCQAWLPMLDGVMLGRAAYHEPYLLAQVDNEIFAEVTPTISREQIVERLQPWLMQAVAQDLSPRVLLRHVLGLYQGQPGARRWRQKLSDPQFLIEHGVQALQVATSVFHSTAALPPSNA